MSNDVVHKVETLTAPMTIPVLHMGLEWSRLAREHLAPYSVRADQSGTVPGFEKFMVTLPVGTEVTWNYWHSNTLLRFNIKGKEYGYQQFASWCVCLRDKAGLPEGCKGFNPEAV